VAENTYNGKTEVGPDSRQVPISLILPNGCNWMECLQETLQVNCCPEFFRICYNYLYF